MSTSEVTMEQSTPEAPPLAGETGADGEAAACLLRTLFDEQDLILFRPIETWTEDGRKRSRVDHRHTFYRKPSPMSLQITMMQLLKLAPQERLNLFFGVCPRLGGKGRFDLAWQIRTVRALWTDVDHVTVDEALARVARAGLPPPSALVNSGNGVHLYWLLETPCLIDDAGAPPPVQTEWVQTPDGRKKPRQYYMDGDDRVYLESRRHVSRLSPKAQRIQDILSGIAQACGGDHTTDLSRLLRLPGTLNRKDERNGRPPTPTALVECDPSRRYPPAAFEPFAKPSPETERTKQIAAMPLPRPRRVSASKGDKLAELVAACAIAPAGSRSEADFALCCWAIRNGVAKEDVWGQVENTGKFAEQGRRYFDVTWDNAGYDVRAGMFDKLRRQAAPKAPDEPRPADDAGATGAGEAPGGGEECGEAGGRHGGAGAFLGRPGVGRRALAHAAGTRAAPRCRRDGGRGVPSAGHEVRAKPDQSCGVRGDPRREVQSVWVRLRDVLRPDRRRLHRGPPHRIRVPARAGDDPRPRDRPCPALFELPQHGSQATAAAIHSGRAQGYDPGGGGADTVKHLMPWPMNQSIRLSIWKSSNR